MVKLVLPEEVLGVKPQKICWHHGNCDICERRNTLVLHFNYDKQPKEILKSA